MSATILNFPAGRQRSPVPGPLAALEPGRKALVIADEPDGRVSLRLAPAVTPQDELALICFDEAAEARHHAYVMHETYPLLYQVVIDTTAPEFGGAA